jgi:hypothetical protein
MEAFRVSNRLRFGHRHGLRLELEPRRIDHLHGAAITSLEARAQRLVSAVQLFQTSYQRRFVHLAT